MKRSTSYTVLMGLFFVHCGEEPPPFNLPTVHPFDTIEDREPGEREPLTAPCDDADPLRCSLPWPSSRFTREDATTVTGLRVTVEAEATVPGDDLTWMNLADGFSTVTGIATAFPTALAEVPARSSVMRLLRADDGRAVPLRLVVTEEREKVEEPGEVESLLVGYPLRPLRNDTDYVALVLTDLEAADGEPWAINRATELALGLATPEDVPEKRLEAYHAPTRATLAAAGIEPTQVLRVWDFTTRSSSNTTHFLLTMQEAARAAVSAGGAAVEIDEVEAGWGSIAARVEGRLTGLPNFRGEEGDLLLDGAASPAASGTTETQFRVLIPAGTGDYPVAFFGHGMGGNYSDSTFDQELAGTGLAKVGTTMYGWANNEAVLTAVGFIHALDGTAKSTAGLLQAMAETAAVQAALGTILGDTLAAAELLGNPNPAAGRRPDASAPIWTGGSLGGTVGLTYASADPDIRYAALNVPGAAWTHFLNESVFFEPAKLVFFENYPNAIDMVRTMVMSQGSWDPIDGAAWVEHRQQSAVVFLIQESMGDPIMPNIGNAMVAASVEAVQIGVVLEPIEGLVAADSVADGSGITQYRVEEPDDMYAVHGFADRNTPAGDAAREQIAAFLASAMAGAPLITVPEGCTLGVADGSCDFYSP